MSRCMLAQEDFNFQPEFGGYRVWSPSPIFKESDLIGAHFPCECEPFLFKTSLPVRRMDALHTGLTSHEYWVECVLINKTKLCLINFIFVHETLN